MGATADETPRLEVCEIFASIQGESTLAGWPCVLIRLSGCPLRCSYCDTPYAFAPGRAMSPAEILSDVRGFGLPLVELTGGEPLAQAGAGPLIAALLDEGYRVLVETGGGVSIEGIDPRARVILDIKTPESGVCDRQDWANLERLRPHDEIKIVICSRADYEWARAIVTERGLDRSHVVHFAPNMAGGEPLRRALADWIIADRLPVRLNLQLHAWIWGPGTRGV
jgi:7-carboxy-7-deazaguanine synthase